MKLAVITCAVFPSQEEAEKKLWIFLASCKKFNIMPHFYGVGRVFPGYREMKLDWQLEYLKTLQGYTHVLYTDSWDAFFLGGMDEICDKYISLGSPAILTAAYSGLANVSNPNERYPNCFDESKYYRYPHVGGYIAEIPAIIEAFEKMDKSSGDDCFSWYDAWRDGWFQPELDYKCSIFQVTDANCGVVSIPTAGQYKPGDEIPITNIRLGNIKTMSFPEILHLSGGYTDPVYGKDEVLKPWAQRLGII